MQVTRKEPVDNPVFIELTEQEAEILVNYLGRTSQPSTKEILRKSKLSVDGTNNLLFDLYNKLTNAGVKYARD